MSTSEPMGWRNIHSPDPAPITLEKLVALMERSHRESLRYSATPYVVSPLWFDKYVNNTKDLP